MNDTGKIQEELLKLEWKDFSNYPKNGQSLMVHAEGFDTQERVWKHFFFELENFNLMEFPTEEMMKTLNKHHCKWNYKWLEPKNE